MSSISKWMGFVLTIAILAGAQTHQVYAQESINPAYSDLQTFITSDSPAAPNPSSNSSINLIPNLQGDSLIAYHSPAAESKPKKIITKMILVTAYSSSPWETDSTPFVTASGTIVRDGVIAANFLPFGAKVKLPEFYGSKELFVEDRMNKRYWYHIDIWMPSYAEARNFGAKWTKIEIES